MQRKHKEASSIPTATAQQASPTNSRRNAEANRLSSADRPVHDWYRFVLSFPPHLVREYLRRFAVGDDARVLDPFCGTGTTLVEAKKQGIAGVGIEANLFAHFASQVKLDWSPDSANLVAAAEQIAQATVAELQAHGIDDAPALYSASDAHGLRTLDSEANALLLSDSISALPLHKALVLRDHISTHGSAALQKHLWLALARVLVFSASNLQFGPEVGVGPAKPDAPVVEPWLAQVRAV